MIIETKINFKRYLKLMFTLNYRKPVTIFLTIAGLLMILVSMLYFMGYHLFFNEPPHLMMVLGLLIVALLPFSIYRNARANFMTYDLLQEKINYEFTEEKIIETGETFDSEMEWTDIFTILELNDWMILYQNSGGAIFLPKESFGEHLNEFKDLVRSKNIAAKLKA